MTDLDDYREGDWTPVLVGWTVVGATTLTGTYTKIGRLVFWTMSLVAATSLAAAAATSSVTGLPFTAGVNATGHIVDSNITDRGGVLVLGATIYPMTIAATAATLKGSGTFSV